MKDDDAARAQKLAKEKQAAQQLKDFELQTAGQVSSAAFSILQNSIKQQTDAKLAALENQKNSELSNSNLTSALVLKMLTFFANIKSVFYFYDNTSY
jgi:hypothetical protein